MNRSIRCVSRLVVGSLLVAVACWANSAHAVSYTWIGASIDPSDAIWSNSANWDLLAVPGTSDTATFNAAAGLGGAVIDLGSGATIGTIVFDTASAAAYTIGSGAVGGQTLTLDDTAAVTMNDSVTTDQLFNAAITLGTTNRAGTTTFTNNVAAKTLTFAGNITGSVNPVLAGAKILAVDGAGNTTISGNIANGGATSVSLTKSGAGTLTLSGVNTYSGDTQVRAGTLDITGSITSAGVFYGAIDASRPATIMGGNASLTLTDLNKWASVGTGNVGNPSSMVMSGNATLTVGRFSVGGIAGGTSGSGEFAMKDSAILTAKGGGAYGFYVQGDGASGTSHMLLQDNAIVNTDRLTISSNFGTLTQTGGQVNCTYSAAAGQWLRIANGSGRWGWYNLTGGQLNINTNPSSPYILSVGTNRGIGYINLAGTAAVNLPADADFRLTSNQSGSQGYFGEVNLAGGTLTTPVVRTADRDNLGGVFNFNGGTLKAAKDNPNFMENIQKIGATWNGCNVYAGGAVIDTNGFSITIAQPLAEPAGQGVTSVSVSPGTKTYVAPPRVSFSQPVAGDIGYPTTAQGFATLDSSGHVNGIVLTNPGSGYTSAPTLAFDNGDALATAAIGSVGGGGLTKNGAGTLTLTGANTYTGLTRVTSGVLELGTTARAAVIGSDPVIIAGGGADIKAGKILFDYADRTDGDLLATKIKNILTASSAVGFVSGNIYTSGTAGRAIGWADNGSPTAPAVTVMYTLYGDATLDGVVNFDDLSKVLTNYNGTGNWGSGDVTYDGTVNFDDLSKVLTAYNTSLGAGETGSGTPTFGPAGGFTVVPEPSSVVLLVAGLMGLLAYSWRKRS